MLTIFNTLTRQKEIFKPLQEKKVGIYVCGVTVYDFCHLGHARTYVAFDMVIRYLRAIGYEVKYVRNITDIDDKIIKRAQEQQCDIQALTQKMTAMMHEDLKSLNVQPPTQEPKATECIASMIHLIQKLLDKKVAYLATNGDVYYSVKQFPAYGKLAHKDLEGLQTGARVDANEAKENPLDFVLWKKAKPNEPAWDSPFGAGRPGWHIECSAMGMDALGETFDIHGGGMDLQFPHHENEIAQSEAATEKPFVKLWMHTGFLEIDQEKMSKSLNNFLTIREVLHQHSPEVIRYFLLSSHYRSGLNYSDVALQNAKSALDRFYTALRDHDISTVTQLDQDYVAQFHQKMEDDFNTPEAIAVLFDLVRELNRTEKNTKKASELAFTLKYLGNILGFLQLDPNQFLQSDCQLANDVIESKIRERNLARQEKNWKLADVLREELKRNGIILEDNASGTQWRKM